MGQGVRQTLQIIKREIPQLNIFEVETGTRCFDWEVPEEWEVNEAYILNSAGKKIVDFKENNLHLVGYSKPVDTELELKDLKKYLHSIPSLPDAIPYVTSYYKRRWGFCLSHKQLESLENGKYRVKIDSNFKQGSLSYGEVYIKGQSDKEVYFSSYICHPSMANNELSGPVVLTSLVKNLLENASPHFSYRIVFLPETIGSICYLSKNLLEMKKIIVAGFNVSCVGDDGPFSMIYSRRENTLSDKALLHVLNFCERDVKKYSFLSRGSDERQYCAPNIDLPVVTFCRTKFGEFKEYHNSLDNLNFVTSTGLNDSIETLTRLVTVLENSHNLYTQCYCEPQLGKRGLYPTLSKVGSYDQVENMMNLLAYADGRSLLEIAELINVPVWHLLDDLKILKDQNLIDCSWS